MNNNIVFNFVHILFSEVPDEEFIVSCLLMVFVAVSIPKLARMDSTVRDQGLWIEDCSLV